MGIHIMFRDLKIISCLPKRAQYIDHGENVIRDVIVFCE